MICQICKDQVHEKCRGGTWCDCQHRVPMTEFVVDGGRHFPPVLIAVPEGVDPDDFIQELTTALSHDRPDL